ncbi:C2H2-type domain-containing protein [Caenorhabditis elegans]|uniref:C2H2-type domain-containing protein n=1 Tax=Caenorhabditis elegans TaxID=6239 RepID=H2KYD3_CAEEL|nr:C2H2-type domain-containing protein [Caenorhabditis elegans]CCD62435.1 C2H2-type domain-containing protein [Caenorhabditis elegans]|eukprot:NP_491460.1 Uncharacterized protein CELE_F57C9.4 [Caenorhabditis elegans]
MTSLIDSRVLYESDFSIFNGRLCSLRISAVTNNEEGIEKIRITSPSDATILLDTSISSDECSSFIEILKEISTARKSDPSILGPRIETIHSENEYPFQMVIEPINREKHSGKTLPLSHPPPQERCDYVLQLYAKEKVQHQSQKTKVEELTKQLQQARVDYNTLKQRCDFQEKEIALLRQITSSTGSGNRKRSRDDSETTHIKKRRCGCGDDGESCGSDCDGMDDDEEDETDTDVQMFRAATAQLQMAAAGRNTQNGTSSHQKLKRKIPKSQSVSIGNARGMVTLPNLLQPKLEESDDGYNYSGRSSTQSNIDKLELAVRRESIVDIGRAVIDGIKNKTLTENQLEEFCKTTHRPNISIFRFYKDSEECTKEENEAIMMGQTVMMKMLDPQEKAIAGVQASISSLSASFANQTKLGLIKHQRLTRSYVTLPVDYFPSIDLTEAYNSSNLFGADATMQLTNFYQTVLKNVLNPVYMIWIYTYRPSTVRTCDKHFVEFPQNVITTLFDMTTDIVGLYLPEYLLDGEIDPMDPFLLTIDAVDPFEEIMRRRTERKLANTTFNHALGRAMKNLRSYHYDPTRGILLNCSEKKNCGMHLQWEQMRKFREYCRKENVACDDATPEEMIAFNLRASKVHYEDYSPGDASTSLNNINPATET